MRYMSPALLNKINIARALSCFGYTTSEVKAHKTWRQNWSSVFLQLPANERLPGRETAARVASGSICLRLHAARALVVGVDRLKASEFVLIDAEGSTTEEMEQGGEPALSRRQNRYDNDSREMNPALQPSTIAGCHQGIG